MSTKPLVIALAAAVVLGAAGYGLYLHGMRQGMTMAAPQSAGASSRSGTLDTGPRSVVQGEEATRRHVQAGIKAGDVDPASGKRVLYYHDPMVPGKRFDTPGKSPFMDMMLVPVYADADADQGKVTVSPRIQQNLGIRMAAVEEGTLSPEVSTVGNIAFNERDQAIVQARATGYVERLHVRATLDRVARGQPLADLYIPDWIAAQEEFLAIRRMRGANLDSIVDAARQRMRQVGMAETQIALVETSGQTQPRMTITAPVGGVVAELMVREGMTVSPGATMFRINGLGTVWANAEVPESQSALLRPGAKVRARAPALPGSVFDGKVQAILPEVSPATRTLKARVELANPGGRLVPGMFVQMQFMDMRAEKALLVPTEAVIQTGKRTAVMLAESDGRFRPVDVEIGIESGGRTEIRRGLQPGQRVVVSSQFLIDSEASLRGVEARLNEAPKPAAAEGAQRHHGEAKVERIAGDEITLSHGPIPSLRWGAMTMDFKSPPQGVPRGLQAGDTIAFEFYISADGLPQLTGVTLAAPAGKAQAGGKP